MQTIKTFLKPDLKKILLFAVFVLMAAGGGIQAWSFNKISPKPILYDILRYFPFWYIWVMVLLLPMHLVSVVLGILGINIMSGRGFWAGSIISSYLFACFFIVSLKSYAGRFGNRLWALLIFLPVAVSMAGGFIPFLKYFSCWSLLRAGIPLVEKVSAISGQLIVVWVYEYILVCAIFYAYDALGRIKVNPVPNTPEKAKDQL